MAPHPRRLRRLARRFGLGRALALALLAALVLVRLWDPFPVEAVRLRTFDAFQALRPRIVAESPVAVVDIDEASLKALGQWPWPRTLVAEMVERATEAGAAAIAFDVVFAEPDRASPATLAARIPDLDPVLRERIAALPDNDAVLAAAIGRSRVILGQSAVMTASTDAVADARSSGVAVLGPGVQGFLPYYPGILRNLPALEEAAAGRGLFTVSPEADGIVRRVPMIFRTGDRLVPALAVEILRVLAGAGAVLVRTDEAGVASVRVPGFEIPTDAAGQVWVHFGPHAPDRFIPAADLVAGRVPRQRLADKIVLVGTSAVGLLDNRTTPVARSMPGVEVHAQLLEGVLARATLFTPAYAVAIEILVAVLLSLAIIWLAPVIGAGALLALGALVAATLAGLSWHRFAASGTLLDATFPLATTFLVYATLVFTNYFREQVDQRRIRSAFGRYLSPALVDELARNPDRLALGGEARRMTILFSDVRGFTGISESLRNDPQGLTTLMNRLLTPLTDAILEQRGTIDKYMGDAIMAFWNAPLDDPDQEGNACAAALAMQARMRALNEARQAEAARDGRPYRALEVGVGINTGDCVVGNMGSTQRFDYSVLGDAVNLASRIEGQSKTYGARILVGAETAAALVGRFALLEVDLIRVKGKTEPERILALAGDGALAADPRFTTHAEHHASLIAAYRAQDWAAARSALDACRGDGAELGLDDLYALYGARIAAFAIHPPGPGWDGVHVAETK